MSDTPVSDCAMELFKLQHHDWLYLFKTSQELERALNRVKQESASHASTATVLGFECQRLQAEVNDLKKRLSAFTDL